MCKAGLGALEGCFVLFAPQWFKTKIKEEKKEISTKFNKASDDFFLQKSDLKDLH